jgi:putative nucleotidyltransferase with HDIG domain
MNLERIKELEREIKGLHYEPEMALHSFSDSETKEFYQWFWDIHIKPVIGFSKKMAEKYGADMEVVWLGAMLHDIARLEDAEPHDEIGSKKAYKLLVERGFDTEVAEKVREVVLRHRCRKYPPETLEQKIIASADAMAHFIPPFYLWIGKYSNKSFSDVLEKNRKKIERDYNEKIFFEDEKESVRGQYEVLKSWMAYEV